MLNRLIQGFIAGKWLVIKLSENSQREFKNKRAKMSSARLAKVLNLLTETLTRCLCNAREHVAKSGEIRHTTIMR